MRILDGDVHACMQRDNADRLKQKEGDVSK